MDNLLNYQAELNGKTGRNNGNTAIDIQHIGSTVISSIHAKPIIDLVIGVYDELKQKLAIQFSEERRQYTEGKQQLIDEFLGEARLWRTKQ